MHRIEVTQCLSRTSKSTKTCNLSGSSFSVFECKQSSTNEIIFKNHNDHLQGHCFGYMNYFYNVDVFVFDVYISTWLKNATCVSVGDELVSDTYKVEYLENGEVMKVTGKVKHCYVSILGSCRLFCIYSICNRRFL